MCSFAAPKGTPRSTPFAELADRFDLPGGLFQRQLVLLDLPRTFAFHQLSLLALKVKLSDVSEHGRNPQACRTAFVRALAVGLAALYEFAQQLSRDV